MVNDFSEKEKIIFGKIFGVLLLINNKLSDDNEVPDYIIKGLTHGVEPIIDTIIGGGHFTLTSNDFSSICKILEKYKDKDIRSLDDILEYGDYSNLQWEYALSYLKDNKQFLNIINKIECAEGPISVYKNLSLSKLPLIYYPI